MATEGTVARASVEISLSRSGVAGQQQGLPGVGGRLVVLD